MVGDRFIIRKIDGNDVKFHKMTPYDWKEVSATAHAKRRAELESNLTRGNATDAQKFTELELFDQNPQFQNDCLRYATTPEGAVETYLRALRVTYGADSEGILKRFTPTIEESLELRAELWGVGVTEKTVAENTDTYGSGKDSDPLGPETDTYQTAPAMTISTPATSPIPSTNAA